MNHIQKTYADNLSSADTQQVIRFYSAPSLTCYGDLHALTKSGQGSLEAKAGGASNAPNGSNNKG